jgi:hypothetical protein
MRICMRLQLNGRGSNFLRFCNCRNTWPGGLRLGGAGMVLPENMDPMLFKAQVENDNPDAFPPQPAISGQKHLSIP